MRKLEKEERCAGGPRALKREPAWRGGVRAPSYAWQPSSLKPNKAGCAFFISGVIIKSFFPRLHCSVGFSPHLSSCQRPELSDQESRDQSGAQRRGKEAPGQESSVRM